jgi:hypothetical protein
MEYTIGRKYKTLAEYWKEWTTGKPGSPLALKENERRFGNWWRKDRPNEGKYLSKFKKVTTIVESVLRQSPNLSERAAIEAVEEIIVARGIDKDQV